MVNRTNRDVKLLISVVLICFPYAIWILYKVLQVWWLKQMHLWLLCCQSLADPKIPKTGNIYLNWGIRTNCYFAKMSGIILFFFFFKFLTLFDLWDAGRSNQLDLLLTFTSRWGCLYYQWPVQSRDGFSKGLCTRCCGKSLFGTYLHCYALGKKASVFPNLTHSIIVPGQGQSFVSLNCKGLYKQVSRSMG